MAAWRARLVPKALALFVVQNPLEERLPEGTKMDSESRQWFIHANDAIGVRSRAQVLAALVEKYIHNDIESDWISLASGAAIPVLEALRTAKLDGQKVHLTLVDNDPVALRWAETMAAQEGLNVGEQLTLLNRHLLYQFIRNDDLLLELGEHQAELVDALGIFEYFNDTDAVIFLQRALRLVKPGGAVIVSNMLTTSPQIDFILRCIGWAPIFPRSLQQLQDIHIAAGCAAGERDRGGPERRGVCGDGSEGLITSSCRRRGTPADAALTIPVSQSNQAYEQGDSGYYRKILRETTIYNQRVGYYPSHNLHKVRDRRN